MALGLLLGVGWHKVGTARSKCGKAVGARMDLERKYDEWKVRDLDRWSHPNSMQRVVGWFSPRHDPNAKKLVKALPIQPAFRR